MARRQSYTEEKKKAAFAILRVLHIKRGKNPVVCLYNREGYEESYSKILNSAIATLKLEQRNLENSTYEVPDIYLERALEVSGLRYPDDSQIQYLVNMAKQNAKKEYHNRDARLPSDLANFFNRGIHSKLSGFHRYLDEKYPERSRNTMQIAITAFKIFTLISIPKETANQRVELRLSVSENAGKKDRAANREHIEQLAQKLGLETTLAVDKQYKVDDQIGKKVLEVIKSIGLGRLIEQIERAIPEEVGQHFLSGETSCTKLTNLEEYIKKKGLNEEPESRGVNPEAAKKRKIFIPQDCKLEHFLAQDYQAMPWAIMLLNSMKFDCLGNVFVSNDEIALDKLTSLWGIKQVASPSSSVESHHSQFHEKVTIHNEEFLIRLAELLLPRKRFMSQIDSFIDKTKVVSFEGIISSDRRCSFPFSDCNLEELQDFFRRIGISTEINHSIRSLTLGEKEKLEDSETHVRNQSIKYLIFVRGGQIKSSQDLLPNLTKLCKVLERKSHTIKGAQLLTEPGLKVAA